MEPIKYRPLKKRAKPEKVEYRPLKKTFIPKVEVVIPDIKIPDVKVDLPKPPEVQKVEVQNQVNIPKVEFPKVQKVEIVNPAPVVKSVVIDNWPEPVKPPKVQHVEVDNQIVPQVIPVRRGKRVLGDEYVPVRLTDGERFYKALDEMYVAASKGQPGNILLGYVVTGQKAIAFTGTAINLPDNPLKNGVIITAKSTNLNNLIIGMSNVQNTQDGTGNGYILEPGSSVSYAVTNTNTIWVNGVTSDVISWSGS